MTLDRMTLKKNAVKNFEDKFYSLPLWCRQGFMIEPDLTGLSIKNDRVDELSSLDEAREKIQSIISNLGNVDYFSSPLVEVRYAITSPGRDSLELGASLGGAIIASAFYDFEVIK